MKQTSFFKKNELSYGGSLMKKRKGRQGPRPLATKHSMHLVLRSSKAKGAWSFLNHHKKVHGIIEKFATKYGVRVLSLADAGNHLHLHIQLGNRHVYRAFIRAVTAAIAMAVTKFSRWKKAPKGFKFWDRRPFSRVVIGLRALLNVRDYVRVNQIESQGFDRAHARLVVRELWPRWKRSG